MPPCTLQLTTRTGPSRRLSTLAACPVGPAQRGPLPRGPRQRCRFPAHLRPPSAPPVSPARRPALPQIRAASSTASAACSCATCGATRAAAARCRGSSMSPSSREPLWCAVREGAGEQEKGEGKRGGGRMARGGGRGEGGRARLCSFPGGAACCVRCGRSGRVSLQRGGLPGKSAPLHGNTKSTLRYCGCCQKVGGRRSGAMPSSARDHWIRVQPPPPPPAQQTQCGRATVPRSPAPTAGCAC